MKYLLIMMLLCSCVEDKEEELTAFKYIGQTLYECTSIARISGVIVLKNCTNTAGQRIRAIYNATDYFPIDGLSEWPTKVPR